MKKQISLLEILKKKKKRVWVCSVVLVNLCGVTHHGDLGIICAYYFSTQLQEEFLQVTMTMKTYLKAFWSSGVPELVHDHVTCVKGCPGDKGKVRTRQVEREKHLFIYLVSIKKSDRTDRSVC